MKTTRKTIYDRQTRIIQAIRAGECTINCAGAIYVDGPCHCKCHGYNHGALWFDEIAVTIGPLPARYHEG